MFHILPRDRGTHLPTDISCYALPYGGLGFASHVLTYYTILCLGFGRRPLQPLKRLMYGKFGLILAVVGLLGGFILSTLTMVRCRHHWQLVALAIWRFSMSLFSGIVGVHVAYINHQHRRELQDRPWDVESQKTRKVFLWGGIYIPGMIVGAVALISLISENWQNGPRQLRTVTLIFGIPALICIVLVIHGLCSKYGVFEETVVGLPVLLPVFLAVAVVYGDWALGAMTKNVAGLPTDNKDLYYLYWVLKRSTMLSW